MMTGEEFTLLLNNTQKVTAKAPAEVAPKKHYEYGIAGLAKVFGCSIPTANRIKKSGVIDAAISQVGRIQSYNRKLHKSEKPYIGEWIERHKR